MGNFFNSNSNNDLIMIRSGRIKNVTPAKDKGDVITLGQVQQGYVPYTGATDNLSLGSKSISATTGTFVNAIINAGAAATGLYIETDNSGNQFPLVINSSSGANSDIVLQGTNNSRLVLKNLTGGQRWFVGNNVIDNAFGIGSSGTFNNNWFKITLLGSVITAPAALNTTATSGFLHIPSCAGAPSGVPVTATGTIPIVYDSTNNFLYVYNGGWKKSTVYS
nr:hypothetical protein [uncultured Flavobacterium sp.]